MKYLCLICIDETKLQAMSAARYSSVVDECFAYEEELRKSGILLAAEALESTQTATTVRVREGQRSITDGPFAETKEQMAGFFLVDARDLDQALEVAANMPQARIGSIEVRPLKDLMAHERAEA